MSKRRVGDKEKHINVTANKRKNADPKRAPHQEKLNEKTK